MHEHLNSAGDVVGTTRVTIASRWDDYARSEAIAFVASEGLRCQTCGQMDSTMPIPSATRNVTWPNGEVYEVIQMRCLACGARELVTRDWAKLHEKDQAVTGQYMEADGRQVYVKLLTRGGEHG